MAIAIVFLVCLAAFLLIGMSSARQHRKTKEDYLIASRAIHPWLMALSAVSTNSSGFMFIGLIGATYKSGFSAMWLMFGWIAGDYLAWHWLYRRLRQQSEAVQAGGVPDFLAKSSASRTSQAIVVLASLVTVAFLGTYAGAQLTAGSKALHALVGWPMWIGAVLSAVLIAMYCFSGGIRATIWTNTAQSIVMIGSMFLLMFVALRETGGFGGLWSSLHAIDPALTDWRPADAKYGFTLFLASWIMAGVGVIGQPHLMTIAMTIDSADNIRRARNVYFTWYVLFSAACIVVGLACRVLLPDSASFDSELALPRLAELLLPEILIGAILAGLFAATISTADTQILCSSGAISQHLAPWLGRSYRGTKGVTLLLTVGVLLVSLYASQSVFQLVTLSWAALASSLGPLFAVRAFGYAVRTPVAIAMILAGLAMTIYWRYGLQLSDSIYDVLPGMLTGWAVFALSLPFGSAASRDATTQADTALAEDFPT